jgi:hypothetical protein
MPNDTVNHLVHAALDAMEHIPDEFNDRELLSASFTLAMRCADVAIKRNESLRASVLQASQLFLLRYVEETKTH